MILTHTARSRISKTMGEDALDWCHDLVQYVFQHGTLLEKGNGPANRDDVLYKSMVVEYAGTREEWRGRYVHNDDKWIVIDFYKCRPHVKRRKKRPLRVQDPFEHAHKGITVW